MKIPNILPSLRLLAMPILLIAAVQICFAFLSLFVYKDDIASDFLTPAVIFGLIALFILHLSKTTDRQKINYKESMLFVSLTWIVSAGLSAVPIMLVEHVSYCDAYFEAMSALTTTGATILSGLDDMPKSFLMYRQFLQWLGGLGVVIFVVAILPMLNVGGMRILKAETPGPIKDEKIAPRIANSAQYLWYVYVVITLLCAFGYVAAGMDWYEAFAHSFSTVSTGGFSTHDASIAYFNSAWVEINADIFMILGAISFGLHFQFFHSMDLGVYKRNEECRIFIYLVFVLSGVLAIMLFTNQVYPTLSESILKALFHLISFITSTGFGSGNFADWPAETSLLLVFASYLGGCAGSTAGGNKIIRNILSVKIFLRQIKNLIHQQGVFLVKFNGKSVSDDVISSTMAFMTLTAFMSILLSIILTFTGLDFWSAFTAVSACVNVLGPGYGAVGSNFQPVNDFGTWVLSLAMLLGRLEFFTVLVLFSKKFWRH